MRGELEARSGASMVNIAGFCTAPSRCAMSWATLSNGTGRSTDIEDRKRTEEALRESEQRFRDYAETASDWLWETGPDHRVTRVSDHLNAVVSRPQA